MLNRLAAGARERHLRTDIFDFVPRHHVHGCRSFLLATFIVSADGLVVALLVLAAVAFSYCLTTKARMTSSQNDLKLFLDAKAFTDQTRYSTRISLEDRATAPASLKPSRQQHGYQPQ